MPTHLPNPALYSSSTAYTPNTTNPGIYSSMKLCSCHLFCYMQLYGFPVCGVDVWFNIQLLESKGHPSFFCISSCVHGKGTHWTVRVSCEGRNPVASYLFVPTLWFGAMSMVSVTASWRTARPRSAMAHMPFFFTRMFFDFKSRWAIPGFPGRNKIRDF
jgi:hypothetical protein